MLWDVETGSNEGEVLMPPKHTRARAPVVADTMLRKIPCQPGRKPKNIEESKREEEIPLTESNVELLISELDPFTTPLRLNRTFI